MFEFFRNLLGKKETPKEAPAVEVKTIPIDPNLTAVPAFLPADPEEYQLVSLIATAIAAGDQPTTKFVVKNIQKRNPEAKKVALIATSLAAFDRPEKRYQVKSIYQVGNKED